ncbi:hypothetical protein HU200_056376 [Digitaria exilis]|uniref:Uncharacterized protein n=1 Tax=Digitaria exilis TaxID=1010633 RepID=A0A835AGW7_9POAL|nr:hypothetical protein HU200_056376 [Digitaria exilis]CAB3466856.1 unnamed protein product [Digitaria exilis]
MRCLHARAEDQGNAQPQYNYFVEERDHILTHYNTIRHTFREGCLYIDAADLSAQVCALGFTAAHMAAEVMDSIGGISAVDSTGGISADTIHATLKVYVDVFVRAAEYCYKKRFMKRDVLSFLDALRGLASISHILLEASLEALSHTHPRESLSEYAYNCDIKTMHREFNLQMTNLEDDIRNTETMQETGKLVLPTILKGVKATESILVLMMARRKRALEKASKVVDSGGASPKF